jgi:TonB-dependent starch-binding outer membrane protein SusC
MQVFATLKAIASSRALPKLTMLLTKYRYAVKVMKLTAIILLVGCLQLSARGLSQNITLSLKDVPLQKVFKEIERQTDYTFFTDKQWLQKAKKVTIIASGLPLSQVLELCFKDQPFSYSISGKTITLGPKKEKIEKEQKTSMNNNPPIDVKGRVLNSNREPVAGATVSVQGSAKRTLTNANGEFTINGVEENSVVVISHVQYETITVTLRGNSIVNATMQLKISNLDELQVIAYGTTTKRFNTGNISSVKAADIEKQPINNPLLALQGRVPGLTVTQTSGVPGSGVVVRIQGQNSLISGNSPLYVIDGVPFPTEVPIASSTIGILGNSGELVPKVGYSGRGNALSFINPSDIESIEILKDADATAIYGSRAANGAILITTKKGVAGKTKVDINLRQGWGKVANRMDLLSTQQYLEMRNEAFKNDGLAPSSNPTDNGSNGKLYAPDLTIWDTTRNTDWQKELIGGTAQYSNISASVSGGIPTIQYIIGGTYQRETAVFPGGFSDERGSMHVNLNNSSSNQKFQFQVTANYMSDNNQLPQVDLTDIALLLPPNAPSLYDQNGELNWALNPVGNATWINPLASSLYRRFQSKTNNLVARTNLSYEIIRGLKVSSNFGYNTLNSKSLETKALLAEKPNARPSSQREASYGDSYLNSWIFEPQLTYNKVIGNGKVDFLIGSTFQRNLTEATSIYGSGYTNDDVLKNQAAAAAISSGGQTSNEYKYNAIFGRLNYTLVNKYIINISGRRDGSSRFGESSRFHNFYGVGAAWIFSEESLIKKNISELSFGKLKASYGTTGSDQIGDYAYLSLYNNINLGIPYQGSIGLSPGDIPNPYLEWEETKKLSLGIELGFFNNRILFTGNYAKNKSSNQLLSYNLPRIAGRGSVYRNFPATVQNTNWEFTFSTTNISKANFSWNTSINLTIARNELVDFPNLSASSYASTFVVGEPVNVQKIYKFLGVDPTTGLYIVEDNKGNATSSPTFSLDRTVLLSVFPTYYGGLQNSLRYKGFQLDFLFQFIKQIAYSPIYTNSKGSAPGIFSTFDGTGNHPASVMDRWQKGGDDKPIQRFTASNSSGVESKLGNAQTSDASYVDGSFVRLKNISISYDLPAKWRKKAHFQYFRVNAQGQNIFTITNYERLDPESQSLSSLPPLRMLTVGIQVGL